MSWLWCILLLAGCRAPAEQVVVRVGEQTITVWDFDQMAALLRAGPLRDLGPIDGEVRRKLLEVMIDKHLLLLEARARRLDQVPELVAEVKRLEKKLLLNALYEAQLGEEEVGEAEVERYFHEGEFDQEIRLSHILCDNPEEAEQALTALGQGAAFANLAAECSNHRPSASRGGDMGFMPLAHMLPEVREAILSLQPGQVYPAPVSSRYGFHVFKVVERRAADFSACQVQVRKALEARQRAARQEAYNDSLKRAYGLVCDPRGQTNLCTWKEGALSRTEYYQAAGGGAQDAPGHSAAPPGMEEMALHKIVVAEARNLGYHLDPGLRGQIRRRQEELLAERLRAQVVAGAAVGEEEMRAFHAAHPELYGPQPEVEVEEILVVSLELAAQLRQRLEAGEEMEKLAAQYHTRAATRDRGGRMWLTQRDNPLLGPLAPAALDGQEGILCGPLKVPGGFSLFRVMKRRQTPGQPFEKVRHRIAAVLRAKAQNEELEELLSALRGKYAAAVQIYPQALELTLAEDQAPNLQEETTQINWSGRE